MTEQADERAPTKRDFVGPSTIHDVAKAAGVSARTVSRVINDLPRVSPQTRERILEVIRELNFSPNLRARALATSRSYLLGLVHNDPNSENVDQLHRGLFRVCTRHHYEVVTHPLESDADAIEEVLSFVRRSRVDGLVLMAPCSENEELVRVLRDQGVPTVAVASVALADHDAMLISKEREASADVAKHLLQLGHREIGFISGPLAQRSAREREAGFIAALRSAGIVVRPEHSGEGDYSFESGIDCARAILNRSNRPTAIYASNDRMAAGILTVAAELGIRIPDDLSVVGFDNSYLASVLNPALTTIDRPMVNIGERAAEWLVRSQSGQSSEREQSSEQFELKLVVRRSTAKCRS
jgi:LacI family transcriptional regulator